MKKEIKETASLLQTPVSHILKDVVNEIKARNIITIEITGMTLGVIGALFLMLDADGRIELLKRTDLRNPVLSEILIELKRTKKLTRKTFQDILKHATYLVEDTKFIYPLDKWTFLYVYKKVVHYNEHSDHTLYINFFGKNKYRHFVRYNKLRKFVYNNINDKYIIDENDIISISSYGKLNRDPKSFFITDDIKDQVFNYLTNAIKLSEKMAMSGGSISPGIILYGEPGTGKSSFVDIIASKFGCTIEYINPMSIKKNMRTIISECRDEDTIKMFVFEDIDILFGKRDDSDIKGSKELKENFHYLLQLLDGYLSSSNIIKIATTNHIEKLDPALTRSGRFDLLIEMKGLDRNLAEKMCDNFNVGYDILDDVKFPVNPSYLQGKIISKYHAFYNNPEKENNIENPENT